VAVRSGAPSRMSGVVVKASPFGGAQQARLDPSGEAIEAASPYVLSPFV
jgi:hypothetical protein